MSLKADDPATHLVNAAPVRKFQRDLLGEARRIRDRRWTGTNTLIA